MRHMIKLHTHLSITECQSRLAAAVDIQKLAFTRSGYAGSKEILAKLSGADFRLQKRRTYRNSFAPLFYGKLVAAENGTRVEGEFRMHPAARVFMTFWFGFLATIALAALILTTRGQPAAARFPMLLVTAGLAAFGVALVKFGGRLGRNERVALVDFLKCTFDANDAAHSVANQSA